MIPPPDICGWTALPAGRHDWRWAAIKDAPWHGFTVSGPGRFSRVQQLVNDHMTYASEPVDRWDPPYLAWVQQAGDCEEFAAVKRAILLASGIPDEDLFFTLAYDVVRRQQHALLLARQGDYVGVLDVAGPVYGLDRLTEMRPYLAYTGAGAWVYGRPGC